MTFSKWFNGPQTSLTIIFQCLLNRWHFKYEFCPFLFFDISGCIAFSMEQHRIQDSTHSVCAKYRSTTNLVGIISIRGKPNLWFLRCLSLQTVTSLYLRTHLTRITTEWHLIKNLHLNETLHENNKITFRTFDCLTKTIVKILILFMYGHKDLLILRQC